MVYGKADLTLIYLKMNKNQDVKKFRKELLQRTLNLLNERSNENAVWSCRRKKRDLNWFEKLLLKLGLIDEDYRTVTTLDAIKHEELKFYLRDIVRFFNEEPVVCSTCGSENLAPDPAGYYRDAETPYGAWLLCVDCGG
jgi:hypothetical protein